MEERKLRQPAAEFTQRQTAVTLACLHIEPGKIPGCHKVICET